MNLPFTRDEFLNAAGPALDVLPENAVQPRSKPRASGLAGDAREQAYSMQGLPHDGFGVPGSRREPDSVLTSEQGRMYEELLCRVLECVGWPAAGRQVSLPEAYPVSGHPDGFLGDGWGVEFKHLGRYKYLEILKHGLEQGAPEYLLQGALYSDALGYDNMLYIITSQDASSIRSEMTQNLRAKNPRVRWAGVHDWQHPKVMLFGVDMKPLKNTLIPQALERARWLAGKDPLEVALEYNPFPDSKGDVGFPWSYSTYLSRAQADGQCGEPAPGITGITGRYYDQVI